MMGRLKRSRAIRQAEVGAAKTYNPANDRLGSEAEGLAGSTTCLQRIPKRKEPKAEGS